MVSHPLSSVLPHKPSCSAPPFFPVQVLGLHAPGRPPPGSPAGTGVPWVLTPVSQKLWARPGGLCSELTARGASVSRRGPLLPGTLPPPASAPQCPQLTFLFQTKLVAAFSMRSQPSAANPPSLHPPTLSFSFPTLYLLLFGQRQMHVCVLSPFGRV